MKNMSYADSWLAKAPAVPTQHSGGRCTRRTGPEKRSYGGVVLYTHEVRAVEASPGYWKGEGDEHAKNTSSPNETWHVTTQRGTLLAFTLNRRENSLRVSAIVNDIPHDMLNAPLKGRGIEQCIKDFKQTVKFTVAKKEKK